MKHKLSRDDFYIHMDPDGLELGVFDFSILRSFRFLGSEMAQYIFWEILASEPRKLLCSKITLIIMIVYHN